MTVIDVPAALRMPPSARHVLKETPLLILVLGLAWVLATDHAPSRAVGLAIVGGALCARRVGNLRVQPEQVGLALTSWSAAGIATYLSHPILAGGALRSGGISGLPAAEAAVAIAAVALCSRSNAPRWARTVGLVAAVAAVLTGNRGLLPAALLVLCLLPRSERRLFAALVATGLMVAAPLVALHGAPASGAMAAVLAGLAVVGLGRVGSGSGDSDVLDGVMRRPIPHPMALACVAIAALLVGLVLAPHSGWAGRLDVADGAQRFTTWRAAATDVLEHPLEGNSGEALYPLAGTSVVTPHAHNEPLDVAARSGLLAGAALVLMAGLVLRRTDPGPRRAALVALCSFGLWDATFLAIVPWLSLGAIVATSPSTCKTTPGEAP